MPERGAGCLPESVCGKDFVCPGVKNSCLAAHGTRFLELGSGKMQGYAMLEIAGLGGYVVSADDRSPWCICVPSRQPRTGRYAKILVRSVPTGVNSKRISEHHA